MKVSKRLMWFVVMSVVAVALATSYAFRPEFGGTPRFWAAMVVVYVLLGGLALFKMRRDGTWLLRLRVKAGDLTWGILLALALLVLSSAGRAILTPTGAPAQGWLFRLYLQIGASDALQASAVYTLIILLLAFLEEVVWRGAVLDAVNHVVGARWGFALAALLYAVAHLPTAYWLRDPVAGYNPLLVLAAVGCGLCWALITSRLGRLPPAIVSHMVFSYFSAVQFRLPGL